MSAPKVPACGVVDCLDPRKTHSHPDWVRGLRVVVEPKRPSAPGWAYGTPHGTVTSQWPYPLHGREVVDVDLGDDAPDVRPVPLDLLTRYHSWRRRKPPEPKPKLLPALSRRYVITDPDVEQPSLFEAS